MIAVEETGRRRVDVNVHRRRGRGRRETSRRRVVDGLYICEQRMRRVVHCQSRTRRRCSVEHRCNVIVVVVVVIVLHHHHV